MATDCVFCVEPKRVVPGAQLGGGGGGGGGGSNNSSPHSTLQQPTSQRQQQPQQQQRYDVSPRSSDANRRRSVLTSEFITHIRILMTMKHATSEYEVYDTTSMVLLMVMF